MIINHASARQYELGMFLRARRESCKPESYGISDSARRRTPGLRREEVAYRSSVSITWYTHLEQGRVPGVSAQVLESVARALQLDPSGRLHMFHLAGRTPPGGELTDVPSTVSPASNALVNALEPNPAVVINHCWDILGWNRSAAALMVDPGTVCESQRNVLWLLFVSPHMRELYDPWQEEARRMLGVFRCTAGSRIIDPRIAELADKLTAESSEFRAWWPRRDVRHFQSWQHRLVHPQAGPIRVRDAMLDVTGSPGVTMLTHIGVTLEDREKLKALSDTE